MIEYWKLLYSIPLILVAVAHVITVCSKSRSRGVPETARAPPSKRGRPNDDDDFNLSVYNDQVSDPLSSGSAESDNNKKRKLGRLFGRKKHETTPTKPDNVRNATGGTDDPDSQTVAAVREDQPSLQPMQQPESAAEKETLFLDLPDDILLEVLRYLADFRDRMRVRVTHRLCKLEEAAAPVANGSRRILNLEFHEKRRPEGHMARLERRPYHFFTLCKLPPTWVTKFPNPWPIKHICPVETGISMLRRVMKCASFTLLDLVIPVEYEDRVYSLLPIVSTFNLYLKTHEWIATDPVPPLIGDYLFKHIRQNERLRQLRIVQPERLLSIDRLAELMRELRARPKMEHIWLRNLSLEAVQCLGWQLMGIGPALFDNPPEELSEIRATIARETNNNPQVSAHCREDECLRVRLEEEGRFTTIHFDGRPFSLYMQPTPEEERGTPYHTESNEGDDQKSDWESDSEDWEDTPPPSLSHSSPDV